MEHNWKKAYEELNQKFIQKCAFIHHLETQFEVQAKNHLAQFKQMNDLLTEANKKLNDCGCHKQSGTRLK